MNATSRARIRYHDWLRWLTEKAEFPAYGHRFSKEARARRDEKASLETVRKLEVQAVEYE